MAHVQCATWGCLQAQAFVAAAALPQEPCEYAWRFLGARIGGVLQVEWQHAADTAGAHAWAA